MTRDELMAALRRQGILSIEEVRVALLEETGAITAVKREHAAVSTPPASGATQR
ncbi:MAG: YetF domain-containing protein [Candidatus Binatia bacterium]